MSDQEPNGPAAKASGVPPETGDEDIDRALARMHRTEHDADDSPAALDDQLSAGERVNEVLNRRLADLGGD